MQSANTIMKKFKNDYNLAVQRIYSEIKFSDSICTVYILCLCA